MYISVKILLRITVRVNVRDISRTTITECIGGETEKGLPVW